MEGTLRPGQEVLLMHTDAHYQVEEVGLLQLRRVRTAELAAGAVGYVIAGVKAVSDIDVGDTITEASGRPASRSRVPTGQAGGVLVDLPMSNEEYPSSPRPSRSSSSTTRR